MYVLRRIVQCVFVSVLCSICTAAQWTVTFRPDQMTLQMDTITEVSCEINNLSLDDVKNNSTELRIQSANQFLANVNKLINKSEIAADGHWNGTFTINAEFLGKTNVFVELRRNETNAESSDHQLPIVIVREERVIDHIFTGSIVILVSILYINFGAALDLPKLKAIIVRPIGPAIAMFCQYLFMPLLSYTLAILIFPNNYEMQLGLFFTGVSPGGGASNMWTIILGGNMDLSIAITTISNFLAFAAMPLWLFTLGKVIFDNANINVPYTRLASYVCGLIIPLIIGLLIQRYLPRVARILTRILKSLSSLLILFIVIFAIVTNLYLFKLLKWEICVAGLLLPWLGYCFSWTIAKLTGNNSADTLAIAIDGGIQNTGIAIFVLRLTLPQPDADLTTIIPVAVAIMTPFPLLFLLLAKKYCIKQTPASEIATPDERESLNKPPASN